MSESPKEIDYKVDYKAEFYFVSILTFILLIVVIFSIIENQDLIDSSDELLNLSLELSKVYESQTKNYHDLKNQLCSAGMTEFCSWTTVRFNECSDEGIKICKPLFGGEYCVVHYCSGTKIGGDVTVIKNG